MKSRVSRAARRCSHFDHADQRVVHTNKTPCKRCSSAWSRRLTCRARYAIGNRFRPSTLRWKPAWSIALSHTASAPPTSHQRFVLLVSGRYAMLNDGMGFNLVSWRPVIEQWLRQQLAVVVRVVGWQSAARTDQRLILNISSASKVMRRQPIATTRINQFGRKWSYFVITATHGAAMAGGIVPLL